MDSSKSAILHSGNSTEFIRTFFLSCFFLTTRKSHNWDIFLFEGNFAYHN